MLLYKNKTISGIIVCLLLYCSNAVAQSLQYSRQNVFINNPADLQLVANISGTHHLLSFSHNEEAALYIFNDALELKKEVSLPIKFAERASLNIIPFDKFYYLYMRPRYSQKYGFWKIDMLGNCTDMSDAFEKLLQSQSQNMESGFQLTMQHNGLNMIYHTYIPRLEKNVVTMLQLDSGLTISNTRKVMYAFKQDQEKLQQEALIAGKYMLVLKTSMGRSVLRIMKVDISTGLAITNEFISSGYFYTQCSFDCNNTDSTIIVSALLTEPGKQYDRNHFAFVTRLNNMLVEQTPLTILRSQFKKNTGTNFLMVDGFSGWCRLKTAWTGYSTNTIDERITVYQDLTTPNPNYQNAIDNNRLLALFNTENNYDYSEQQSQGVRFSLLNKNLGIVSDSLVRNNRDYYTLNPDRFTRFEMDNKDYLLIAQRFTNRRKGLLLVQTTGEKRLSYRHLPVLASYDYLLPKAQVTNRRSVIIPYLYKLEAGLIKITIN